MKDFGWCRAAEVRRVRRPGDGQGREAAGGLGCCQAVVDVGPAVQADAGMAVFVVVPLNRISQEASSVGQGAETLGEGRCRSEREGAVALNAGAGRCAEGNTEATAWLRDTSVSALRHTDGPTDKRQPDEVLPMQLNLRPEQNRRQLMSDQREVEFRFGKV
jgi:hypothetical protein